MKLYYNIERNRFVRKREESLPDSYIPFIDISKNITDIFNSKHKLMSRHCAFRLKEFTEKYNATNMCFLIENDVPIIKISKEGNKFVKIGLTKMLAYMSENAQWFVDELLVAFAGNKMLIPVKNVIIKPFEPDDYLNGCVVSSCMTNENLRENLKVLAKLEPLFITDKKFFRCLAFKGIDGNYYIPRTYSSNDKLEGNDIVEILSSIRTDIKRYNGEEEIDFTPIKDFTEEEFTLFGNIYNDFTRTYCQFTNLCKYLRIKDDGKIALSKGIIDRLSHQIAMYNAFSAKAYIAKIFGFNELRFKTEKQLSELQEIIALLATIV